MIAQVRVQILTGASLVLASLTSASDEPPVFAVWSDSEATPAVCLEQSNWFISVIPRSVDIHELEAPPLKQGDSEFSGTFLYVDGLRRLCVIQTDESIAAPVLNLAKGAPPRAGLDLHCFYSDSACESTIAGKDFVYRGEQLTHPLLRVRIADADEFCHPGAPLLNESGELVGILTERDLAMEEEGHAIPASQLRKLFLDLKHHDRTGPVWIGLVFHNESSTPIVLDVKENSPASAAGFLPGDVILSFNKTEIEDLADLVEAIYVLPAEHEVPVTILRGLEEVDLSVIPVFANTTASVD